MLFQIGQEVILTAETQNKYKNAAKTSGVIISQATKATLNKYQYFMVKWSNEKDSPTRKHADYQLEKIPVVN